ncbi:hypothetical protein JCM11491_007150 [Sporobolomyces phaffii]
MCRWIAYFSHDGPILVADLVIRPAHSLLNQVDEHYLPGLALDAPAAANDRGSPNNLTNVDGFGIGFYSTVPSVHEVHSTPERRTTHPDLLPAVYKCVAPPIHDLNLHSLAHAIESKVVLGHIRAASASLSHLADPCRNCHPFQWGRFLFQHNGRIGRFAEIQIELMSLVGPRARSFVKGTTDTEWLAALFFHLLDPSDTATWLDDFPLSRQLDALALAISTTVHLVEARGGYYSSDGGRHRRRGRLVDWFSANVCVTDGERLVALRYAYPPAAREPPSLYYSTTAGATFDRKYRGHPDDDADDAALGRTDGTRARTSHAQHVVVASEPMTADEREWDQVRPGEILAVERGEAPRLTRLARFDPVIDP